jgi:hypothetical protein
LVETPNNEISRYGLIVAIATTIYSVVILSFGGYSLASIWPANSTELASNQTITVTLRATGYSFSLGPETLIMVVMVIVGSFGACVYSLWAIARHVGKKDFQARWLVWYLVRPFTGAGLSVIFYFLLRGGILTIGANLQNLNLIAVAAISGLVGMFSEQAVHKLNELADTTFGTTPNDQTTAKPSDKKPGTEQ